VVTQSEDKPTPKWLDAVEETCPKCQNPEMDYYTLQLRSADEGQTVFYECKKCGHKFSVNN
jgi:DNA-directed RNA polymerase I subunit RPA12